MVRQRGPQHRGHGHRGGAAHRRPRHGRHEPALLFQALAREPRASRSGGGRGAHRGLHLPRRAVHSRGQRCEGGSGDPLPGPHRAGVGQARARDGHDQPLPHVPRAYRGQGRRGVGRRPARDRRPRRAAPRRAPRPPARALRLAVQRIPRRGLLARSADEGGVAAGAPAARREACGDLQETGRVRLLPQHRATANRPARGELRHASAPVAHRRHRRVRDVCVRRPRRDLAPGQRVLLQRAPPHAVGRLPSLRRGRVEERACAQARRARGPGLGRAEGARGRGRARRPARVGAHLQRRPGMGHAHAAHAQNGFHAVLWPTRIARDPPGGRPLHGIRDRDPRGRARVARHALRGPGPHVDL